MPTNPITTGERFERLVGIMARLRAPDGCPWDREQKCWRPWAIPIGLGSLTNSATSCCKDLHAARIFRSRGIQYDAPNAARKIELGIRRQEVGVGYQHPLCRAPNSLCVVMARLAKRNVTVTTVGSGKRHASFHAWQEFHSVAGLKRQAEHRIWNRRRRDIRRRARRAPRAMGAYSPSIG